MKLCHKLLLLSAVVFLPQFLNAQDIQNADVLSDSAKKYLEMIKELESSTPQEQEVTEERYNTYLCVFYCEVAMELYEKTMMEEALECAEKAAGYGVKSDDIDNYYFSCKLISDIARYLNRIDVVYRYLDEAIAHAEGVGDTENVFNLLLEYHDVAEKTRNHQLRNDIAVRIRSFNAEDLSYRNRLALLNYEYEVAINAGDPELALIYVKEYRNEVEQSSSDAGKEGELRICLQMEATCHYALRDYNEAARCYELTLPAEHNPEKHFQTYLLILSYYITAENQDKVCEYIDKLSPMSASSSLSDTQKTNLHYQLCTSLAYLKRYEEAYEQILAAERFGMENKYVLITKGSILHELGRDSESKEVMDEYVRYCYNEFGPESIDYADALRFLGNIEGFCGDLEQGAEHLIQSFRLVESIVRAEFPYVSHDKVESFWNNVSRGIEAMAGYAVGAKLLQGDLTSAAYEGLVLSKGLLLSSEKSFAEHIAQSGNPELNDLYARTLRLRNRMEDLRKDYVQNKGEIMSLQKELAPLEAQLAQQGSLWADQTSFLEVTFEQLKSSLKDNEIVIDMVDHPSEEFGRKYHAYVYRKDWEHPLIVPLCTQMDLDSYSIRSSRPDVIYGRKTSAELIELLWKPLEQYVTADDRVYIIPSGDMHMISYDSFQLADGTLLGSRYDFIRLSSAREILDGVSSSLAVSSAVLYGGLQYNLTDDERIAESQRYGSHLRGTSSQRGRLRGESYYDTLPMTREEVLAGESLLTGAGVDSVKCFMGKEGTEESFMSLGTPSPQIIHLATHGFYYTPEDAASVQGLAGYKNAMMLSGLVLAGGNAEWMGNDIPENTLGGILTAEDISQCNLSDTELVILTACDTGKGEVTSEGVYGLQRAFKKAGAKSIIMNLWKTDDDAAKEFMGLFYESFTTNGWDRHSAFKYAKEKLREKYRSPFYWAGFIMLD